MHRLYRWHKTSTGYLVFGIVELAMAYVFASWAVDSGRLLAYFLTIVFFVSAVTQMTKLFRKALVHYGK